MKFKDYYDTLGVSKNTTDKEIKQAYRRLARKHHPDVNPGNAKAESDFKDITEAYEVLGNPETRRKYNELGANWKMYEQPGSPGTSHKDPFGRGMPFGGGGGGWTIDFGDATRGPNLGADGGSPFSDFFNAFFGGAPGQPRSRGPRRRETKVVDQTIDLSLEEAFLGVERRISILSGNKTRMVSVRIPPGVSDRSRIRIPYGPEVRSTASGEMLLRVRIIPHPKFRRKGRDLHTSVTVPLTTAILGGAVPVQNVEGITLNLKIPTGTQPGQVFRLKGQGMPGVRKPEDRGALYATVELLLPTQLNDKERAHYEALAKLAGSNTPEEPS